MPLNRVMGEKLDGMSRYEVVPTADWSDTGLFEEAVRLAKDSFAQAGALMPVIIKEDDCLVQEYPDEPAIAFIFQRKVGGREMFYPFILGLSPGVVADLRVAGRWRHTARNRS